MNTRFKITLSTELPINSSYCQLGYPDQDYMANNIAIIEKGNTNTAILINNNVLREALLDNKDFCLKYLGLKVYDRNENPEKIVEKIVTRTITKKETTKPNQDSDLEFITVDEELIKKYPQLAKKLGKKISLTLLKTFTKEE